MKGCWKGSFSLLLLTAAGWGNQVLAAVPPTSEVSPTQFSFEGMEAPERELVQNLMDRPTLYARGPQEPFQCRPEHFYWFLDHPDKAVVAWRRLGARCVNITPRGPSSYAWTDTIGSEVVWVTVQASKGQRIWYAQGKVKPGKLLPAIPVKAVVVLQYSDTRAADGTSLINQRTFLYLHTDSKSAALVTKMLGGSSQHVAEQGLEQLQLFFSGLSWYMHRHPDQSEALLRE
jgi:hypothetical protein